MRKDLNQSIPNNQNTEGWMSWPVIIIALIFFWPLGLYLLWKRIGTDKKAEMASGMFLSVIGWIFIAFGALGIIGVSGQGPKDGDIPLIIFFLAAGAIMIYFSRRIKSNALLFKKYIDIVGNRHVYSLENIAGELQLSISKVKADLQKMINKGYFHNAFIDEQNNEIIMPEHNIKTENIQQESNNVEMVIVKCKSCGANNSVARHSIGECEFCGSPIAGE